MGPFLRCALIFYSFLHVGSLLNSFLYDGHLFCPFCVLALGSRFHMSTTETKTYSLL